jgi:G3E family GTPase
LVSSEELAKVRAFVHKLNPAAKIITSTYANVSLDVVLNTGLFNFEQAALGTFLPVLNTPAFPCTSASYRFTHDM